MATDADAARKRADADGIEFVFAQFVDMNGKPSAKLVPIENWDGLVNEGAGFAGFAAYAGGARSSSGVASARPTTAARGRRFTFLLHRQRCPRWAERDLDARVKDSPPRVLDRRGDLRGRS